MSLIRIQYQIGHISSGAIFFATLVRVLYDRYTMTRVILFCHRYVSGNFLYVTTRCKILQFFAVIHCTHQFKIHQTYDFIPDSGMCAREFIFIFFIKVIIFDGINSKIVWSVHMFQDFKRTLPTVFGSASGREVSAIKLVIKSFWV